MDIIEILNNLSLESNIKLEEVPEKGTDHQ